MTEDILTDLLASYASIPPYAPDQLTPFYQNMGYWLAVTDEETYSRWVMRFIYAIQIKHPDISMMCISWFVQNRIADAMLKEVPRA